MLCSPSYPKAPPPPPGLQDWQLVQGKHVSRTPQHRWKIWSQAWSRQQHSLAGAGVHRLQVARASCYGGRRNRKHLRSKWIMKSYSMTLATHTAQHMQPRRSLERDLTALPHASGQATAPSPPRSTPSQWIRPCCRYTRRDAGAVSDRPWLAGHTSAVCVASPHLPSLCGQQLHQRV